MPLLFEALLLDSDVVPTKYLARVLPRAGHDTRTVAEFAPEPSALEPWSWMGAPTSCRARQRAVTLPLVAEIESSDRNSKLVATGSRLRIDAAAAEVLGNFERAGVEALVLKGPSFARWLYSEGEPRSYVDCDLLVAPTDLEAAEEVLGTVAYSRDFDDRGMPSWWREHASAWVRESDGVTVDLHRTLPGLGVDAEAAWRVLSANPDVVEVAGHRASTLAIPAQALHVALHAAQHGVAWPRPMADLERALTLCDDDLWLAAAQLALRLQATDAFATGLGLTPAGTELASRLGLPPTSSVDAALRAASAPSPALGFEQLARAGGMRARAWIVWRKLVPPASFIRHWDPRAGTSRVALARAYLRRPLWTLRRVPGALRAWRGARRSVRAARANRCHK